MKYKLLQVLFPNKWGGTNYYHYEHRVRMVIFNIINWIKLSKIFLTFWKLPRAIEGFNNAVDYAKHEIKDLHEVIERKEDQVDTLIVALIEEYTRNQMSTREAHREVYQMTYYDKWVDHIPSGCLTEEEAVEIVNVLPKSLPELRSFTFGWKKLILSETLEKILKIIAEHS